MNLTEKQRRIAEHKEQILHLLEQHGEMAIKKMMDFIPVAEQTLGKYMHELAAEGRVHVARRVLTTSMWAAGASQVSADPINRIRAALSGTQVIIGRTVAVAMTAEQIGLKIGLSETRTRDILNTMHADKQVYVRSWKQYGQSWAKCWALGDKRDRPKPKPISEAEQQRRHRAKRRAEDPERYAVYLAKERLRNRENKARAKKSTAKLKTDVVTRALFGDLKVTPEEMAEWERKQAA